MPARLIIKRLSNTNIIDNGQRWERGEIVAVLEDTAPTDSGEGDVNLFYNFTVTDKTVQEMNTFLASYNRDLEFTLINAGPPRRYEVRNLKANTLGAGYWTISAVNNIKTVWEIDHPQANITTIGFPNESPPAGGAPGLGNIWDMSGVFQPGEGAEFTEAVYEEGLNVMDARRQWFVDEQGMTSIGNAGGIQSGTAQQIGQSLVDRTLL
jgi:hypothetical protein